MRHVNLIKTGEGRYWISAERDSMDALAAARPRMIETLNRFRRTLEDLGGGLPVEARPATPSRAGQSGPTYANASSNR
jgi:hypothetical protein